MDHLNYLLSLMLLNSLLLALLLKQSGTAHPHLAATTSTAAIVGLTTSALVLGNGVFNCLNVYVLEKLQLQYLAAMALGLVMFAVIATVHLLSRKQPSCIFAIPSWPLSLFANCLILSIAMGALDNAYFSLPIEIISLLVSGSFGLLLALWQAFIKRLSSAPIPPILRGVPITLVCAALAALGSVGISGML